VQPPTVHLSASRRRLTQCAEIDEPAGAVDQEAADAYAQVAEGVLLAPFLFVRAEVPEPLVPPVEPFDRAPAIVIGGRRVPVDVLLEVRPLVRDPRADRTDRRDDSHLRLLG
jgi:hypothetical protein